MFGPKQKQNPPHAHGWRHQLSNRLQTRQYSPLKVQPTGDLVFMLLQLAQSGDECHLGSWVFLRQSTVHSVQGDIVVGRISEIVVPNAALSSNGAVTVEVFQVGDILHPDFDMPILKRSSVNSEYCTVNSKVCSIQCMCFEAQNF
jgi:hypothetical protein